MKGGAVTVGQVVLFTDGSDQAGLYTKDQAYDAVNNTDDDVLTIAFTGDAVNEIDEAVLAQLGKNGAYIASDASQLNEVFTEAADRIQQLQERIYVLGYCSPKLGGNPSLTLQVMCMAVSDPIPFNPSSFNVEGPTCSAQGFAEACDGKSCGGLLCGSCGDGVCTESDDCDCTGDTDGDCLFDVRDVTFLREYLNLQALNPSDPALP